MGIDATIISIKNNIVNEVALIKNGQLADSGVGFVCIAKHAKEVLFKLIESNREYGLDFYSLGTTLPCDVLYGQNKHDRVMDSFLAGLGELFAPSQKNVFTPLAISSIDLYAIEDAKADYVYNGEYDNSSVVVTSENTCTYIIDFDEECLKIYGEVVGRSRITINFNELKSLNSENLAELFVEDICDYGSKNRHLDKEEMQKTFNRNIYYLKKANASISNFKELYLQTIKILNRSHSIDEVVFFLGLDKVYTKFKQEKQIMLIGE